MNADAVGVRFPDKRLRGLFISRVAGRDGCAPFQEVPADCEANAANAACYERDPPGQRRRRARA
jgi:hypothetical protein